jgi:hypothetical protein
LIIPKKFGNKLLVHKAYLEMHSGRDIGNVGLKMAGRVLGYIGSAS